MQRLTAVSFVSLSPLPPFPWERGVRYEKNAGTYNSSSSLLSNFRVQGCGGGFAANMYGAMPEGLLMTGFPFGVSTHQPLSRK